MMAFRESGKSTIMNMANILWSILGKPQKKFVVILSQTQDQAKNHFTNIKDELESNGLLRTDFGPFAEDESMWNKMSLELVYHGSKIMSASKDQSIRGIKYGTIRPDLIICDDLEDSSVEPKSVEHRNLYQQFMDEVMPLGSRHTRIIVLGNLIGSDSFLINLKKDIDEKKIEGIFRAYPLLDDERRILWPEKFPDLEVIKNLKKRFASGTWKREFLLKSFGSGRNNEDAQPIIFLTSFGGRLFNTNQHEEPLPLQAPLIPQMEEFKISVPFQATISILFGKDDPNYKTYLGNIDLDEPWSEYEGGEGKS